MRRFHGVATTYLPNYLAWHRWIAHADRHGFEATVLRWPTSPTNKYREQSPQGGERMTLDALIPAPRASPAATNWALPPTATRSPPPAWNLAGP
jgi:hypothetical protein